MSYQYGSNCYATATLANQALAFDRSGQAFNGGSTVSGVGIVTDTSIEITQFRTGGGYFGSTVVSSSPPVCGLLDTGDALTIAWLICGVWLAVYAVTFLKRLIDNEEVHTNDT